MPNLLYTLPTLLNCLFMLLVSCRSTEELIRRRDEAFLRHFAVSLPEAARDSLVPHHLVSVASPSDFRLAEEKVGFALGFGLLLQFCYRF